MAEQVPMKIPLRANAADVFDAGAPASHGVPDAALSPAKVLRCLPALLPGAAHGPPSVLPAYPPEESSSRAEWVGTMRAIAPLLNPDGLKKALMLFERFHENLQQAKVLDSMIASTCALGGTFTQMPHRATARTMKVRISQQQQILLCQLRRLRPTHPAVSSSSSSPLEAGELVQRLSQQPRQTAAHRVEVSEGVQLESERFPDKMSSCLTSLSSEDPNCLVVVRRISRLGFKAVRKLTKHFSLYGPVVRVLTAPSQNRCTGKAKPSGLGYVHMSTPEAAQAVLALGPEQEVDGVTISVERFERPPCEEQDLEGETGMVKNRQSSDTGGSEATAELPSFGGGHGLLAGG